MMQPNFYSYIKEQTGLPDDVIQTISGLAERRTLRRGELLLTAGDICRYKVFIERGLLRTYNISANGNEHNLQFSPEMSWTLDVES